MIERKTVEFKADVYHTVSAVADTIEDIEAESASLLNSLVACKADQFLYHVCHDGSVCKTNLRSREPL